MNTKQERQRERYEAELAIAKRQVKDLEQAGITTLPIEVAASFLPVLAEYR